MKYLKSFNEAINYNKYQISVICKNLDITNYSVTSDKKVNVNADVDIEGRFLNEIPLNFGIVNGTFDCSANDIKSLVGSPKVVRDTFYCHLNELETLEGGPEKVGKLFCTNNKLKSLKGCPITNYIDCTSNQIVDFIGIPSLDSFFCADNPISCIWNLFLDTKFIDKVNHIYTDLQIGDGWAIQGDVLEQIAEELEIILPNDWREIIENGGYKII